MTPMAHFDGLTTLRDFRRPVLATTASPIQPKLRGSCRTARVSTDRSALLLKDYLKQRTTEGIKLESSLYNPTGSGTKTRLTVSECPLAVVEIRSGKNSPSSLINVSIYTDRYFCFGELNSWRWLERQISLWLNLKRSSCCSGAQK